MLSSASDARRGAPRIFSTSRAKSKMRTKSTLKLPGAPTYPSGEWREGEGLQLCPHPIRCQDPPGAECSGKRDLSKRNLTRGTSAASPSLWGGNWGRLTYGSPLRPRPREGKAPPHCPILCLQAGTSLSESPAEGMRSLGPLPLTGPCPFPYLLFTESFSTQSPFP